MAWILENGCHRHFDAPPGKVRLAEWIHDDPDEDPEKPVKPCDYHIKETLALTREMMQLADKGDADREDIGCGVLYGIIRDSAFKIMKLAEKEKEAHQNKGWWKESGE